MSPIERLKAELVKLFADLEFRLIKPAKADGVWMLDVTGAPRFIAIAWQADKGFGVTTPTGDDYTTTNDEVYATMPAAKRRVAELIRTGEPTSPAKGFRLAELRTLCGISQTELAERLGTSQANVARMEKRNDILLSTMARTLEAMGVAVTIDAKLPSGETRQILV